MRLRGWKFKAAVPLVFIVLLSVFYAGRKGVETAGGEEGDFFVEGVIDGDTIRLTGGEVVRYIGIDTPEVGEPFYEEARARNMELVGGGRVRVEVCAEEPRDRYGRTLAWVYTDGVFVNGRLLAEGLGETLFIPPCGLVKEELMKRLEGEAREKGLGLWGLAKERSTPEGGSIGGPAPDDGETIPAYRARGHVGERVRVKGTVVSVIKGDGAVFLNFGPDPQARDGGFSAVIFKESLPGFDSAGISPWDYRGRVVIVEGVVEKYRGGTEVIVRDPSQIELLP